MPMTDQYMANGSIATIGAPTDNEYSISGGTQQDFAYGSLNWNSSTHAITWTKGVTRQASSW